MHKPLIPAFNQQLTFNNIIPGISPTEFRFISEYLLRESTKKNLGQCYLDAGFNVSEASAMSSANQLLSKQRIQDGIEYLRNKTNNIVAIDTGWTKARVIEEFGQLKAELQKPIAKFTPKGEELGSYVYDGTGAARCLENIGKIIGAYEEFEQKPISINVGVINDIDIDIEGENLA